MGRFAGRRKDGAFIKEYEAKSCGTKSLQEIDFVPQLFWLFPGFTILSGNSFWEFEFFLEILRFLNINNQAGDICTSFGCISENRFLRDAHPGIWNDK